MHTQQIALSSSVLSLNLWLVYSIPCILWSFPPALPCFWDKHRISNCRIFYPYINHQVITFSLVGFLWKLSWNLQGFLVQNSTVGQAATGVSNVWNT